MPTLAAFLLFIRNVMGITTAQLPDDSSVIPLAYNTALQVVNLNLSLICPVPGTDPAQPTLYDMAVYNLAADRLLNWAQDSPNAPVYQTDSQGRGQPFFRWARQSMNLTGFTPGVIQSTNDLTTGGSYVVPEAFKNLTIRDLSTLRTPYGREYMAIAQDYGPSEWGISGGGWPVAWR